MKKKIFLAADHAGFALKEILCSYLKAFSYEVEDCGAVHLDEDDDYPDFISKAAAMVSLNPEKHVAIVIGGSGQGEAMVANRYPNVRAIVFNGQYKPTDGRNVPDEIVLSREHNDSNVLSLGARFLSLEDVKEAVIKWIETPFLEDARHVRRIKKIEDITDDILEE